MARYPIAPIGHVERPSTERRRGRHEEIKVLRTAFRTSRRRPGANELRHDGHDTMRMMNTTCTHPGFIGTDIPDDPVKERIAATAVLLSVLALTGCASTHIQAQWKDP